MNPLKKFIIPIITFAACSHDGAIEETGEVTTDDNSLQPDAGQQDAGMRPDLRIASMCAAAVLAFGCGGTDAAMMQEPDASLGGDTMMVARSGGSAGSDAGTGGIAGMPETQNGGAGGTQTIPTAGQGGTIQGGSAGTMPTTPTPPGYNGEIAYWPCDEGSGSAAGMSPLLMDKDFESYRDNSLTQVEGWAQGKYGSAISRGVVSEGIIKHVASWKSIRSVSFWLFMNDVEKFSVIMEARDIGNSNPEGFSQPIVIEKGEIVWKAGYGGYDYVRAPFTGKKWTHVVISGGDDVSLYVDGKVIVQQSNFYPPFDIKVTDPMSLSFGPIDGLIDEIRIYNGTISDEMAKTLAK